MIQERTRDSLTWRAVLIGLTCATIECLFAPYNDYVIRNIFLAGGHFPVAPFFVLTIFVLGINVFLKQVRPASALSPGELVTIWCIMIAPAGIPSSGMMRYALSPMVAYQYLATPENDWGSHYSTTTFRTGASFAITPQLSLSLKAYSQENQCRGGHG